LQNSALEENCSVIKKKLLPQKRRKLTAVRRCFGVEKQNVRIGRRLKLRPQIKPQSQFDIVYSQESICRYLSLIGCDKSTTVRTSLENQSTAYDDGAVIRR
jgi:hypothetical protein